jgi:hypothetical protein
MYNLVITNLRTTNIYVLRPTGPGTNNRDIMGQGALTYPKEQTSLGPITVSLYIGEPLMIQPELPGAPAQYITDPGPRIVRDLIVTDFAGAPGATPGQFVRVNSGAPRSKWLPYKGECWVYLTINADGTFTVTAAPSDAVNASFQSTTSSRPEVPTESDLP